MVASTVGVEGSKNDQIITFLEKNMMEMMIFTGFSSNGIEMKKEE